ncbi:Ig kappa chain V region BS-5 [Varanus komodoensis]|nr:Ig kappa chain V region BS-5 [Varanus komodoensis]
MYTTAADPGITCQAALLVLSHGQQKVLLSQIPRWVSQQIGGMANMNCYQNFTDHSWMYWYQQKAADQPLRLIGTLIKGSSSTLEEGFDNNKFVIQTEQEKHFSLQIGELNPEDATMYFCASRDHSAEKLQELPTKNRPEVCTGIRRLKTDGISKEQPSRGRLTCGENRDSQFTYQKRRHTPGRRAMGSPQPFSLLPFQTHCQP